MKVTLGYGKRYLSIEVGDDSCIGVLAPNNAQAAEVQSALANPIGTPALRDIVKPGDTVAIVTSDITRPVPNRLLLPALVRELNTAGVHDGDITIVFALGSHRKHTVEEMRTMLGNELCGRVTAVDSDVSRCVRIGTTTSGTPVELFEPVVRANRRICVGNIEYHYFAGFSGGAKALLPGVASHATIQANHSMLLWEGAETGRLDGNPVRRDIDEVLQFCPADFILNVVLDDHKRILRAFAGDAVLAHRAGCSYLDEIYRVRIPKKADIVIASPGGHPKDINLYQAQKALDNAALAVRDGGVVILVARCPDGFGESVFEKWMLTMAPHDMTSAICRSFVLGGHKAAAIASVIERAHIFLVSDFGKAIRSKLPFPSFSRIEDALTEARALLGQDACVLVMPIAGSTLPLTENESMIGGCEYGLQEGIAASAQ